MKWVLLVFATLLPIYAFAAEWEKINPKNTAPNIYVDKSSLTTKNLIGLDGQYHRTIIGWVKYVSVKPINKVLVEMEYTGISCDLNTIFVYSDWQYGSHNSVIASSYTPILYAPNAPIVPDSVGAEVQYYFCGASL